MNEKVIVMLEFTEASQKSCV